MTRDRDAGGRPPDVEIGAAARARSVRFRESPDGDVQFTGASADRHSETERENLPDRVEPGVSYRDVRIRWRASARFAEPEELEGP